MYRTLLLALMLIVLSACESAPRNGDVADGGETAPAEGDELERMAYNRTGDVRLFYYVKGAMVNSAREQDDRGTVEQRELKHILINKSHSFYQGVPDHKMRKEERFLFNADMHDLLVILRDQLGFFDKGNAVNILGDDPIARADSERDVTRIIAVEQIIDGKVNTSYFARRNNEDQRDRDRAKAFNDAQAFIMEAISKAVPRGASGYGESSPVGR